MKNALIAEYGFMICGHAECRLILRFDYYYQTKVVVGQERVKLRELT